MSLSASSWISGGSSVSQAQRALDSGRARRHHSVRCRPGSTPMNASVSCVGPNTVGSVGEGLQHCEAPAAVLGHRTRHASGGGCAEAPGETSAKGHALQRAGRRSAPASDLGAAPLGRRDAQRRPKCLRAAAGEGGARTELGEVLSRIRDVRGHSANEPGVHVLNAHTGKGQQFDWVAVIGLEEGHVPSTYADTAAELLEEQRVLMVMVSRAHVGFSFRTRARPPPLRASLPRRPIALVAGHRRRLRRHSRERAEDGQLRLSISERTTREPSPSRGRQVWEERPKLGQRLHPSGDSASHGPRIPPRATPARFELSQRRVRCPRATRADCSSVLMRARTRTSVPTGK